MESLDINKELEVSTISYIPQSKYGIMNVGLSKSRSTLTGYRWTYVYYDIEKDKLRYYGSYDLRKLRQKVLDNGFDWIITDNRRAIDTYKLNNEMMKVYDGSPKMNLKLSKQRNRTGFYRVGLNESYGCGKGYNWQYRYYSEDDKKYHMLVSTDLLELKHKVDGNGFEWIMIDEGKARESAFLDGYDLEELL